MRVRAISSKLTRTNKFHIFSTGQLVEIHELPDGRFAYVIVDACSEDGCVEAPYGWRHLLPGQDPEGDDPSST